MPLPPRSTFIGRTAEQTALTAALDEAVAGRTQLVLLTGEPGIGKTTLCEQLTIEATT